MKICFLQWGDMRETLERIAAGEPETYRAQYYSVDWVRQLAEKQESVSVISIGVTTPYREEADGIQLFGIPYHGVGEGPSNVLAALDSVQPTHVIMRTPVPEAWQWADRHGAAFLPQLADSFLVEGWGPRAIKQRLASSKLVKALNNPRVDTVSNHNVAACADLVRIGVKKSKIVPWDWPANQLPADYEPKTLSARDRFELVFVGGISGPKGVGDLIDAFASSSWLRGKAHLSLIGTGPEQADLEKRAAGLESAVSFLGRRANKEVYERMRAADLVLVPSRHAYSEGLPGTIYEALTVRTPVVLSDHPMFKAYLEDEEGVIFVPEASPGAFAEAIEALLTDPERYERLSLSTAEAFDRIRCPNLWHEVLEAWLYGDPDGWLADRRGQWQVPRTT